ncbi:hypothetical protein ACFPYJ_30135 [Paenibacillus solisilvae]|uniref:Uncharacterized protein n=1 Tax=Paenibacillus solisilvae TaxID=2486751 RepID=A0ABW0W9A8_9BACL
MLKSKAHKIVDHQFNNWENEVEGKWVYDDFLRNEHYRHGWISLTSLLSDEHNKRIYVGLGSFDTNLLYAFDRESGTFRDLNYRAAADPFDAKFHCSLEMDSSGDLYGALAQFHDVDKQFVAKGGRLVKYTPSTSTYEFLGTPVEGAYIQSIALDRNRRRIYGFTLSPEYLFEHDLTTGKSHIVMTVGNSFELCQSHNPVIDDNGYVWGTYGITRAFCYETGIDSIRLFKYNPDDGVVDFLDHGLPRIGSKDKGTVDRAINIGDGYLYFGGVAGSFSRLDPRTGETKSYGKPCPNKRLAGLCLGKDGNIYGVGGDNYYVTVFRFEPQSERLETLGRIFDETIQEGPVRIHTAVMTDDGTLFCGENDNNYRSSYLWEVQIL